MGKTILVNLLIFFVTLKVVVLQVVPSHACSYCPTPVVHEPPPSVVVPKPPTYEHPPFHPVPKQPPVHKPPTIPYTPTIPKPPVLPPAGQSCPINTLKLDACVSLLNDLVHVVIGSQATDACCPVLAGLADLDAALCLCTAIKVKALNVNLVLPVALQILADCGKHCPSDYQCPNY
ncbi:36.4 kDa proline-rich protein [Acorus calamus]|uniref:36.4 kDa proline-rich protein n=1 Tax=Acorus calamus TaxID=4465 RepID=A0AAV9D9K5_ACOCL|nr:36.4 kDa proline-rich protein [Acorus calamus]